MIGSAISLYRYEDNIRIRLDENTNIIVYLHEKAVDA